MKGKARRRRGINLTPLIDVVFLVLAFLMVCSRIDVKTALDVDLPSINGTGEARSKRAALTIDREGGVHVGAEIVPLADLPGRIAALGPEAELEIRPDRQAPAGVLVEVMDILRQVGVKAAQIAAISAEK